MTPEQSVVFSKAELLAEWWYRYEERLGILTDGREPTDEEKAIAKKEADDCIAHLTRSSTNR